MYDLRGCIPGVCLHRFRFLGAAQARVGERAAVPRLRMIVCSARIWYIRRVAMTHFGSGDANGTEEAARNPLKSSDGAAGDGTVAA